MEKAESGTEGMLAPFRRMAFSVLALAENRVRLFALELQAERLRFVETLLKFAVAAAVAAIGLLLATFTLALYVWHKWSYAGLLVMTAIFVIAGVWLFWRLRRELRQGAMPFDQTINEFKKDRECFTTKS